MYSRLFVCLSNAIINPQKKIRILLLKRKDENNIAFLFIYLLDDFDANSLS